jgi:YD repeat-containing protein
MIIAISGLTDSMSFAQSVTYQYDSAGRLTVVTYATGTTTTYTLDAPGNRKQVATVWPAPGTPGVPSFTNITTTTATASWTAASGTVTSYEYKLNSGAWTSVGTALTVNLTALTSGTSYTVQVHAVNNGTAGAASSASFTTLTALPGAPGTPTFTGITTTAATVSWTAASGTVASYEYKVNSGAWTNVGTARTVNLTGLTPTTSYTVQVHAVNVAGAGPASSGSFTTLTPLPGAPGTPSFTAITDTTATVTWTAASGTVTSYQYSVNSGSWTSVGTALTANLTGLSGATGYTVQVRAVNAGGNGPASSASFTTLAPAGAPGIPTFTNITTTSATVNWTAASGSVASYEYSVNSGTWTNVGMALTVNLSGLAAATSYTVQVHAKDSVGNIGPASTGTLLTLPNAPGTPTFTSITTTTATVTWTAPSGTVTSYQYSVNSGAWTNVGTALSVNLSGLTAATNYTVQVEAINSSGPGAASSAGFVTLPLAPGTPSFASITTSTATVNWTAASGAVTSYQYSVNSGAWTNVGTALTVNLSGLASATNYTVQVEALTASGPGAPSSAGFITLPGTPGTPTFSSITTTTATVSWTAVSGTPSSYAYSVNSGAWTNVGTALTVNLSGLAAGTSYTVQVEALTASGPGAPSSSAAFTTVPPAPGTPTFSSITSSTATASWGAASGSTSYAYSVNSGAWTNVGAALSVNLSGLAPLTSYTVQVEALNSSGTSAASSAGFTTLAVTENATVTSSTYNLGRGAGTNYGFFAGEMGSISPGTLNNGTLVYHQFVDYHGTTPQASVAFTGFSANPGAAWLISATAGSVTQQGSTATFTYTSGEAIWSWNNSPFGFPVSGNVAVSVVHH